MLTTITELPEYIKRADILLSKSERKDVIDYLSEHPKAGDIRKVQEAFVRYVGAEEIKEKVVVLELSITTTMNASHYTF
jgi:hypothetical protein